MNFTTEEMAAIEEQNFFILKNSATIKIVELFGSLEQTLKQEFDNFKIDIDGLKSSNGKIFRGENYKLFPYIMLDCPKLFNAQSIFAFRTMFWWGHEFSFTLHLQGNALEKLKENFLDAFDKLFGNDVYICVNDNPWQYNFEKENYVPIEQFSRSRIEISSLSFIKISRKLPVSQLSEVPQYGLETFRLFLNSIRNQ